MISETAWMPDLKARLGAGESVTPLMTAFKVNDVPPLETSNLLVKQTISVDEVYCTMQSVYALSLNFSENVLVANSCGKFVPVSVMLSPPKRFKLFDGRVADNVGFMLVLGRVLLTGIFPKFVVTSGQCYPAVGFLSRVHSILVSE